MKESTGSEYFDYTLLESGKRYSSAAELSTPYCKCE